MCVARAEEHVLALITLVFAGVVRHLNGNALTTLPVGLFDGLTTLERV